MNNTGPYYAKVRVSPLLSPLGLPLVGDAMAMEPTAMPLAATTGLQVQLGDDEEREARRAAVLREHQACMGERI